ncbi:hypothetical protein AcV5_001532 [Taiwanofungus camphoratus]|nr:hypothetical protein AcV5_001532 [Antrodia cinnamomea]
MSGVGVGLSIGALAVHARFSQPDDKAAIVSALSLFFRALGGTVGLAHSGVLSSSDANILSQGTGSSITSLQGINALPRELQSLVRDAYRNGTRWSFISLIPWAGLAFMTSLLLSKIEDTDRQHGESAEEMQEMPAIQAADESACM